MTQTRNKLLGDIVVASGGVITDPNNRNSLLIDWLLSVGGVPPDSAFQGFNDPINCSGVIYCNQIIGCS